MYSQHEHGGTFTKKKKHKLNGTPHTTHLLMFVGQHHRRSTSLTSTSPSPTSTSSASSTPTPSSADNNDVSATNSAVSRLYNPQQQQHISRIKRTLSSQSISAAMSLDNNNNNSSNNNNISISGSTGSVVSSAALSSPSYTIDIYGPTSSNNNSNSNSYGAGGDGDDHSTSAAYSSNSISSIGAMWKRRSSTQRKMIIAGVAIAAFLFFVYYRYALTSVSSQGGLFGGLSSSMMTSSSSSNNPMLYKYNPSSDEYTVALVIDRDTFSYDKGRKLWTSMLLQGTLRRHHDTDGRPQYRFALDRDRHELRGTLVEKTRGMELSELQWYGGKLYTADDRTGIVYEVKMDGGKDPYVLQRFILPDGDGETSTKGFKCEWMTVKDGSLIVGSMGKEWTDPRTGAVVSDFPMWVKHITVNPQAAHMQSIRHINFANQYRRLMDAAVGAENRAKGGYLLHEAVSWSEHHQRWFFLPRRISKDPYNEDKDVYRGANIIISSDENFNDIRVVGIQQSTVNSRGFSTFKFVPHRPDEIVAIKSEEIGDKMRSFITVITTDGRVLMPETEILNEKYVAKFPSLQLATILQNTSIALTHYTLYTTHDIMDTIDNNNNNNRVEGLEFM